VNESMLPQLNWNPTGPNLLTDLRNMDYGVA
jgi:hypothetical protein